MLDWLMAPIDSARPHAVDWFVAWHARLMVLAWAILIPAGIVIARFFKITPRQRWPERLDNPLWWHSHRGLQYAGGVLMGLALALILRRTGTASGGWHGALGWAVLAGAGLQYLSGWLRGSKGGPTEPAPDGSLRGDHYDMTLRRRLFEIWHKGAGYALALMATATLLGGLWLANGPRWMWLVLALWWAGLGLLAVVLQRRGMAHDTYQAIWGPDPQHPGNRIRPIGWGIRRRAG